MIIISTTRTFYISFSNNSIYVNTNGLISQIKKFNLILN